MQKLDPYSFIKFVFRKPGRLKELTNKIGERFFDKKNSLSSADHQRWLDDNLVDFSEFAASIDHDLWEESNRFSEQLTTRAHTILKDIPHNLGGGGIYPILYFVTRKKCPSVVLETGVAAGFSSQTFLTAIDRNGVGELYSSDFPYFRIPNPEQYIGVLVEEHLKSNWHLFIEGDKLNFTRIFKDVDSIDVFHYDSDKSYSGRQFAMETVKGKLAKDALIILDDINDNTHFYDYVTANSYLRYHVFKFEGKYVGMIGKVD